MEELSIGLAFFAGLASFLSPCVLPLVPAYIGYLGGQTQAQYNNSFGHRWQTFYHGLAFVIGFSLVFIVFGIAVSFIGGYLNIFRSILAKIGGIIVIIFGLQLLGWINIPFLNYDLRINSSKKVNPGLFSSFFMGIFFSAGWSPCIGPILGSIMMLVLNQGEIGTGIVMLSAYSFGLAIPFLILAFGVGSTTAWLKKIGKFSIYIEKASGVLMLVLGIMLITGIFQRIASLGTFFRY